MWVWHLGICFSAERGGAGLTVGLNDFRDLSQHQQFSMITAWGKIIVSDSHTVLTLQQKVKTLLV